MRPKLAETRRSRNCSKMAALRRATVMATMLMTVRGFAIGRGALVGPSPQHLASPATPGPRPLMQLSAARLLVGAALARLRKGKSVCDAQICR